ncbi:HNH endonuclease [Salmonella enterica]|uniref:HNH endonuclease n=1 Tax=Salmonella enterica TaxID=28901 RepID=UPI003A80F068
MNKCLNCNTETKNEKFCSRSCRAIYNNKNRTVSQETKDKISNSLKGRDYTPSQTQLEHLRNVHKMWCDEQTEKLLSSEFESLSYERMRKRIILEQNNTCNKCNLSEWMGSAIPLEIDHINGNNTDNVRTNMEALCPNCHALTDTWRGRNKEPSKNRPTITDEQLVDSYLKCGNIRQALLNLGLAGKGANYGRLKRALSLRNIKY